jgi:hypothetical protein
MSRIAVAPRPHIYGMSRMFQITARQQGRLPDVSFFADVFRDAHHYGVRDDLVEGGLTRSCGKR